MEDKIKTECEHWTCSGCDECSGWKNNPDVEHACINNSCKCHKECICEAECDGECNFQEPYGFVPHAGCPKHDKMTEEERINYGNMNEKEIKIKELFDMVYGWGRSNILTDFESNAFRKKLKEITNLIKS